MRRPALLLLAAAALLAGCGGAGGIEADEAEEVEAMIVASIESEDPADCARYATDRFLEQTTKLRGDAAVAACEESTLDRSSVPERVRVSGVAVNGEEASANVAFVGSSFDGQALKIALIEEDGTWKLDQILAFTKFDREPLIRQFREQLHNEAGSPAETEIAACVVEGLEEFDDQELKDFLLGFSLQPIVDLGVACAPRSQSV